MRAPLLTACINCAESAIGWSSICMLFEISKPVMSDLLGERVQIVDRGCGL